MRDFSNLTFEESLALEGKNYGEYLAWTTLNWPLSQISEMFFQNVLNWLHMNKKTFEDIGTTEEAFVERRLEYYRFCAEVCLKRAREIWQESLQPGFTWTHKAASEIALMAQQVEKYARKGKTTPAKLGTSKAQLENYQQMYFAQFA